MADNPLVSLVLVAYQQERFVKEAIESALAQTYENLEIICSDDGSHDGTFKVMEGVASSYLGPHRVILNRNPGNLGLATNLNRAWDLSSGEIIVVSAGDDISVPHRVTVLVEALRGPPPVDLVCSAVQLIDEAGADLREVWRTPLAVGGTVEEVLRLEKCYALGCSSAYDTRLVRDFGPLDPAVIQEDWVLAFRALLGRGVRTVEQPLVKYRRHLGNMWLGAERSLGARDKAEFRRLAINRLAIAREWLHAWDRRGTPGGFARRRLWAMEQKWLYHVACCDTARLGAIRLSLEALRKGVPLRGVLSLLRRHALRR